MPKNGYENRVEVASSDVVIFQAIPDGDCFLILKSERQGVGIETKISLSFSELKGLGESITKSCQMVEDRWGKEVNASS